MVSKLTELTQQKSAAQLQTMSRESLRWLNKKVAELKNPQKIARNISTEKSRQLSTSSPLGTRNKFMLGGMYFFYYNPKTKNDLPYYDIFPLIIPLEKYDDGFLALNLHYLPIRYRSMFMTKLLSRAVYNDDNEIKRLRVTYELLAMTRRYKEFRPCVKRYLTSHIRSKILTVQPEEWDVAMYLPVHQFRKAPATKVWQESIEEIRNS